VNDVAALDETLPEEDPPAEFDVYSVVHYWRPDEPPSLSDEVKRRLMRQHLAYNSRLFREGHTFARGPLGDDPERRLRAMTIFFDDPDEAIRLARDDPAVRHGLFTVEVTRWHVRKGALAEGLSQLTDALPGS
jgi:hypothetical protein